MRIKGITVELIQKIVTGEDPFGAPIYTKKPILVENVLIAPASSDDIINSQNLYGKKAVYMLGIPKGDTNDWEGNEVKFFNQTFRVFGKVSQGIEEMIPLEWNKKVMVEVLE